MSSSFDKLFESYQPEKQAVPSPEPMIQIEEPVKVASKENDPWVEIAKIITEHKPEVKKQQPVITLTQVQSPLTPVIAETTTPRPVAVPTSQQYIPKPTNDYATRAILLEEELKKKQQHIAKLQAKLEKENLDLKINELEAKLVNLLDERSYKNTDTAKQVLVEYSNELKAAYTERINSDLEEYKQSLYNEFLAFKETGNTGLFHEKAEAHRRELYSFINERIDNLFKEHDRTDVLVEEVKNYADDQIAKSAETLRSFARRILDLGSGGGSNAQQFANGGTMKGNLNVTGQYLSGGKDLSIIFSSGGGTSGDAAVNTWVHSNTANASFTTSVCAPTIRATTFCGNGANVTNVTAINGVVQGGVCFIGGGCSNTSSGGYASIAGGQGNCAQAACSFIGGGYRNWINAYSTGSSIAGGECNRAILQGACYSLIGGGYFNYIQSINPAFIPGVGDGNTIGGGKYNGITVSGYTGGFGDPVPMCRNTISGGYKNVISAGFCCIPARSCNACALNNYIGGGECNCIGGITNIGSTFIESSVYVNNVIAGGSRNCITAQGGGAPVCMVYNSAILGGCNNMITSCNTFALGSNITSSMTRGDRTYVNKLEITSQCASPSTIVMTDANTSQRYCITINGGTLTVSPSYD